MTTKPDLEVVSFSPVSVPKAPGAPVRAGRNAAGQTLLVVRDLAGAMDYTEHRMNMLFKPNMARTAVAVGQVVRSAQTGMPVQVVPVEGAQALLAHIERQREIAHSFGHPASKGERDSAVTERLPVFRVGPFTMNGRTWPAIDVPVCKRHADGPYLLRAREMIRALGLDRSAAEYRLRACLAPSKGYTSGPEPYFHRLFTERQEITFGQPNRPGVAAGKATVVWPLDLAPLLFEALARGRPKGRPAKDTAHHATPQGRATGQYHPVTAPPPQLVSGPVEEPEAEAVL